MARSLIPFAGAELSDPIPGTLRDRRPRHKERLPRYLTRLRDILHEVPPRRRILIVSALLDRCRHEVRKGD
jgi:hypothetical protein